MKRLLIFTMIFCLTLIGVTNFVNSKVNNVNALEDYNISWNSVNIFGSNYVLRGDLNIPPDVTSINFTIPPSDTHALDSGGQGPEINFYDENSLLINTIDWDSSFGDRLDTFIDIDFNSFNIVGARSMSIIIPQNYTSTPPTLIGYMDNFDLVNIYFTIPEYRDTYFRYIENVSPSYAYYYSEPITVPYDTFSINLELEDVNYFVTKTGLPISNLELYDENDVLLDTLLFSTYIRGSQEFIDFTIPADTYDFLDVAYFRIWLLGDFITTFEEVASLNDNLIIFFNDEILTINFYANGVVHDSQSISVGKIPQVPDDPTPTEGSYFTGWFDNIGEPYLFTAITDEQVQNDTVSIYADIRTTAGLVDFSFLEPDPTERGDTSINILLIDLGVISPASRLILFGAIIAIVSIILIVKGVNEFAIIFVDLILTFVFIYLKLIPQFAIILILIILGFAISKFVLGGGATNE